MMKIFYILNLNQCAFIPDCSHWHVYSWAPKDILPCVNYSLVNLNLKKINRIEENYGYFCLVLKFKWYSLQFAKVHRNISYLLTSESLFWPLMFPCSFTVNPLLSTYKAHGSLSCAWLRKTVTTSDSAPMTPRFLPKRPFIVHVSFSKTTIRNRLPCPLHEVACSNPHYHPLTLYFLFFCRAFTYLLPLH